MADVIVISDPQKVAELLAPLVAAQLATMSKEEKSDKRYITLAEAEKMYGLKRTTAWQLRHDGKLKNYGTNRSVRLSIEEIENIQNSI